LNGEESSSRENPQSLPPQAPTSTTLLQNFITAQFFHAIRRLQSTEETIIFSQQLR